jgi:hypothetical protein
VVPSEKVTLVPLVSKITALHFAVSDVTFCVLIVIALSTQLVILPNVRIQCAFTFLKKYFLFSVVPPSLLLSFIPALIFL